MVDTALMNMAGKVTSASLVEAMSRAFTHRAHIVDLVTPTPGRVLFGPAATLSFMPVRDDLRSEDESLFPRLFYEAVGDDPDEKVLVMASNGQAQSSLGGRISLSRLENLAMAGVLCDGRLNDFQRLQEYSFAAYCKGETIYASGNSVMPFEANCAVACDRVTIIPGDFIFADAAGAVVIPANAVHEVLQAAAKMETDSSEQLERIRYEDPSRYK